MKYLIWLVILSTQLYAQQSKPAPDLTVFGFKLGEAVNIPDCPKYAYNLPAAVMAPAPIKTCLLIDKERSYIRFPVSEAPNISSQASIQVVLINGKLEGVEFPTNGIISADLVYKTLKDKYGAPYKGSSETVAIWSFSNLVVSFNGAFVSNPNKGRVEISTPTGSAYRAKELDKLTRDPRPL